MCIRDRENPEVLFAKAVGILEGQTEAAAFPIFARARWGERGANGKGVSLIYTAGAQTSQHIVPFLDALGIPWVIFCDGDDGGTKGLKALSAALNRNLDASSREVVLLPDGQAFEAYLLASGYVAQLVAAIDRHPDGPLSGFMSRLQGKPRDKNAIYDYTGADGQGLACLDFLLRNKVAMGTLVAEELVRPVPPSQAPQLPPLVDEFFTRLDKVRS